MKAGMNLEELLIEAQRQSKAKRDFVASTDEAIRMVPMPEFKPEGVAIVLKREDSTELERFRISENCHRQIAGRLQIPWKYYHRLLTDHTDLVMDQVNALFEREPKRRLLRTLDGVARGFLSDIYKRIDNDYILANTLEPIVKGEVETALLSSYIDPEGQLSMKVMLTDDSLAIDLGKTARGDAQDIVRPGFRMRNSEVGKGKTRINGFFYRDFCYNGCIFGMESAFDFERVHLGGRLLDGVDYEVLSDESKKLEDAAIVSQIRDVMSAIADPKFQNQIAEKLKAAKETPQLERPVDAMAHLAREVGLTENESNNALVNLLSDSDLTKWGAVNAVTKLANDVDQYERANELEEIGAQILAMNNRQWTAVANYKVQEAA